MHGQLLGARTAAGGTGVVRDAVRLVVEAVPFVGLDQTADRLRDIVVGPDGFLYALTDETFGAVLKIEPAR